MRCRSRAPAGKADLRLCLALAGEIWHPQEGNGFGQQLCADSAPLAPWLDEDQRDAPGPVSSGEANRACPGFRNDDLSDCCYACPTGLARLAASPLP